MFDWKHLFLKAASLMGYAQGYQLGQQGGMRVGNHEAQVLILLMKKYGSFDSIPTAEIRERLPAMGKHVSNQQRIKKATIKLQAMLEELNMLPVDATVDIVLQYLENDPNITDENCERITAVLESNSCFGGLISLAETVDFLDVELFMRKIREPLPNPHLDEYYACLKDEYFIVK
jgi:hypothetical protein